MYTYYDVLAVNIYDILNCCKNSITIDGLAVNDWNQIGRASNLLYFTRNARVEMLG